MRTVLAIALTLALTLAPFATGAPSSVQNDAGTGGDAGQWADHPAPLNNRSGGAAGVYSGEMYRFVDEIDYYSVDHVRGDIAVTFTAQDNEACLYPPTVPPDTRVVLTLIDPSGAVAAETSSGACYGTASLRVPNAAPGVWLLYFHMWHPDGEHVDVGVTVLATSTPQSTVFHERYAFHVACECLAD